MSRVRILDLGCGSADGYELLTGVRQRDPNLKDNAVDLLTSEVIGVYKGLDLNADLLEQARAIYGNNPKMVFQQADFTQGFELDENEKPHDLYFTSYGTCSHHNEDETIIRLLADIARRVRKYCVIMCDWLGRYSYEWQTLWSNDLAENRNMDYVVSYIYGAGEREVMRDQLQHLCLRLMSRQEAEAIIAEASKRAGVEIKPLAFFDRSVFTGRHVDTAEYNPHAQALRLAVNSLHEANLRTDLNSLIINYVPKEGFGFLNDYYEHLAACWNTLIHYVDCLLHMYDGSSEAFSAQPPPVPASYPAPLRRMMDRMRRVVEGIGWLDVGLPRENIIEPQLGYSLRQLVVHLQQGQGCGHGFVGILEVDKE
ncbi:MAG TPA: class I SAM-dependent methyltransferase, partial [Planctomycetota bacterium]|nr:class I SAM-dependent methyltransferase [Planctomycetota bacterium]